MKEDGGKEREVEDGCYCVGKGRKRVKVKVER